MTFPNSQKPKDLAFKAFKNEKKQIEMSYNITRDELNHMVKRILGSFTKIKNLEKEKDLNNLLKKKIKVPSQVRKQNALIVVVGTFCF